MWLVTCKLTVYDTDSPPVAQQHGISNTALVSMSSECMNRKYIYSLNASVHKLCIKVFAKCMNVTVNINSYTCDKSFQNK